MLRCLRSGFVIAAALWQNIFIINKGGNGNVLIRIIQQFFRI